jgi:hypothetical protein
MLRNAATIIARRARTVASTSIGFMPLKPPKSLRLARPAAASVNP